MTIGSKEKQERKSETSRIIEDNTQKKIREKTGHGQLGRKEISKRQEMERK